MTKPEVISATAAYQKKLMKGYLDKRDGHTYRRTYRGQLKGLSNRKTNNTNKC